MNCQTKFENDSNINVCVVMKNYFELPSEFYGVVYCNHIQSKNISHSEFERVEGFYSYIYNRKLSNQSIKQLIFKLLSQ